MTLRTYTQTDKALCSAFFKQLKREAIPLYEAHIHWGKTYILSKDGEIKGIGTLQKNELHPHFQTLYLACDFSNPARLEPLFLAMLEQRTEHALPLKYLVHPGEAAVMRPLLKKNGFQRLVTCRCPKIDILASLKALAQAQMPSGYRLYTYADLNQKETQALRQFRLQGYIKTHFWSPPAPIESEHWQHTDPSPDEAAISWVVLKDSDIVLCSDLHIHSEESAAYLGWGWHHDAYTHSPDLKSLWSVVLNKHLKLCQKNNLKLVGEFDSTDIYGQYKASLLLPLKEETYYIYAQKTGQMTHG